MSRSRACHVTNLLIPVVTERGLDRGTGLIQWAEPPWSATLRSSGRTHRMTLSFGRIVLDASWTEGVDLLVHHFDQGGWDDYFLHTWNHSPALGCTDPEGELDEAA